MQFLDSNDKDTFEARADAARADTACEEADFAKSGNSEADFAYCLAAQPGFEALKYAASLLTGTLLLDLTGSDRTVQDRALTDKAADTLAEAREIILTLRPKTENAQHHNHHLLRALNGLDAVVKQSINERNLIASSSSDAFFTQIQACWDELKKLDSLIGGFRTVDLAQSCCSFHAKQVARFTR